MTKYTRVWKQLVENAFASTLSNRIDSASYFFGKIVRFVFFYTFISSLFSFIPNLAGYSKDQALLFFLTFNLIDVLAQVFFRGIYSFKNDIKRGNFDFTLIKPINSLFLTLTRQTDLLDILFLVPIFVLLGQSIGRLSLSFLAVVSYTELIGVSFLFILGIHILSAAIAMITVESENVIWIYREAMTVGRFPPEIFSGKIQFIFTYLIPIIVISGFPTKALLGQLSFVQFIGALVSGAIFFIFSVIMWQTAIKKYSSASS